MLHTFSKSLPLFRKQHAAQIRSYFRTFSLSSRLYIDGIVDKTTSHATKALRLRLLETKSLKFLEPLQRSPNRTSKYAILSHTWREDGQETTYQDFLRRDLAVLSARSSWHKIVNTSQQSALDGLDYFWVDTCCIDKSSSAELSEAINSMYDWYAEAEVCYVYLSDVNATDSLSAICRSRWFTRAWTLQELLAPKQVKFFDEQWKYIGSLADRPLAASISAATGIDIRVFNRTLGLNDFSVAQRMAWASKRQSTRVEDRAYSLLGIFDVNMPLLYGEGSKAFARLQEEIIRSSSDHSILCWEPNDECDKVSTVRPLLASSPSAFAHSGDVIVQSDKLPRPHHMTNLGLEITLPIHRYIRGREGLTFAKLNCTRLGEESKAIALNLERQFDLDAGEHGLGKPWSSARRRRWKEAWGDVMGRYFDWQFISNFARRGYVAGHAAGASRLVLSSEPNADFREQTIVILRHPIKADRLPVKANSLTANPLGSFNEMYLAITFIGHLLLGCVHVAVIFGIAWVLDQLFGILREEDRNGQRVPNEQNDEDDP